MVNYALTTLVYSWINHIFSVYVDLRQLNVKKTTKSCPPEVKSRYSEETFEKARHYTIDKMNFALVRGFYTIIKDSIILYFGVLPIVWDLVKTDNHLLSTAYLLVLSSLISLVENLPWSYYSTFVIEELHGFNKQSFSFFIKDKIKGLFIGMAISVPVFTALCYIIEIGGDNFYFYTSIFMFVIMMFLMHIYPTWIAPLFDNYKELPDSKLKEKIYALADRIKFPLKKLFVVEGSARSSHSNAYMYGFGSNKRIVLYDTLIKGFVFPGKEEKDATTKGCEKDEEIEAVLAHELGHWKFSHTIMNMAFSQTNLFVCFFLFSRMIKMDEIYQSFSFAPNQCPIILKMYIILSVILQIYSDIMGIIQTLASRVFENQADRFAVSLGYGKHLQASLIVLSLDNLSFPVDDWLYSWLHFSHPTVLERIRNINEEMKKTS